MPRIVDYEEVAATLVRDGLKCLYHNSGSFGFPPERNSDVRTVGWIGPDDPTIRTTALAHVRRVAPPFESNLARLFAEVWTTNLPVPLWITPGSHWAYELDFGSPDWLPGALAEIGVDATDLQPRNNGAAIEFAADERANAARLVEALLTHLTASDFAAAFPQREVVAMLHHHKQIWWRTTDNHLAGALHAATAP